MNIQDVIEKIDAHSREIEKLNNERRELDRADLPRDAHNRELNQIVSFLDKETKARDEKEEIVRAYNTMKDNIEAIRRISNIPTKDFYERDEKNKEIEARREEIIKAREILPPELVASLHEEILRTEQKSESAVITRKEIDELERDVQEKNIVESGLDMEEKAQEMEPRNNEFEIKENEYVEVVPETDFVEVEEVQVDMDAITEEYNEVEKEIIGYIQTNNAKLNSLKLHKTRLEEERAAIGPNEDNRVELEKEYDKHIADVEREIRSITNPSKEDELRIRNEKDNLYRLATSKIQKIENIIRELKRENRRLEYEHGEMVYNGIKDHSKWHHMTNQINENTYRIRKLNEMIEKYKDLIAELKKTEKVIDLSPETKTVTPGTDEETKKTGEDGTSTNGDDITPDDETKTEDDDFEPTYDDAIELLKNTLDPEMPEEEIKGILNKIEILVIQKYELEQAKFEKELSEATTVQDKLELIEKREAGLLVYIQLVSHPTKEIDAMLEGLRNKIGNFVATSYNNAKASGEYCWKEFKAVKESKEYIFSTIKSDKTWLEQMRVLFENMEEIINNPDQEQYENWRAGMQQFAELRKLDPEKMLPYVNAKAKIVNPNVSVDKDFNIDGLNLDNSKTTDNDRKKPRRKVTKVEDAKGFFKRHPKLKVVAIGLGILLGSQLGLAGVMMINSALWTTLGGQGAVCGILHAINLGLSKIVGAGLFQFTQAGTYTFLGKTGALALYSSVGAKLTAAAAALGVVGTLIAKKIKGKNEKKMSWLKEKIKNRKWFRRKDEELDDEYEEEIEEDLDEDLEDNLEDDNVKPLENKEELIRQILDKEANKDQLKLRSTLERIIEIERVTPEKAIEIYRKHNLEVDRIMNEAGITREEAIESYLESIKENELGEDAPGRNK